MRDDLCTRCYACVRACPVEAMHVADGAVRADSRMCIGCGSCVQECAHGAIDFADHTRLALDLLAQGDAVAVIAPGFAGAFPDDDPLRVIGALRAQGFAAVWEAAAGAECWRRATRLPTPSGQTVITSACPAAVRLIRRADPIWCRTWPHLCRRRRPRRDGPSFGALRSLHCSCAAFRLEGSTAGRGRVTPDSGSVEGGPDVVLTLSELRKLIDSSGLRIDQCLPSAPDVTAEGPGRMLPLPAGLLHSLAASGGAFRQGAVSATGLCECLEILDALSSGEIVASLVEISLCRGCADGPAYPQGSGAWRRRQAVLAYSAVMEGVGGASILEQLARSGVDEIDLSRAFVPNSSLDATPDRSREPRAARRRSGNPGAGRPGRGEREAHPFGVPEFCSGSRTGRHGCV